MRNTHAITPYTYRAITYRGRRFQVLSRESFSRHYVMQTGHSEVLSMPDALVKWCIDNSPMAGLIGCTPYDHTNKRFVNRWWGS